MTTPSQTFSARIWQSRADIAAVFILTAGLVVVFLPFVWLVSTAIKTQVDAFALPPKVIFVPTLANFSTLISGPFFSYAINSVIVTTLATGIALALGIPAGYGLAIGRFRGQRIVGGWLLISYMTPIIIYILPLYLIYIQVGLINTYIGIVLGYETGLLPFAVWMLRGYFSDMPRELEEQARTDGCTRFQALIRIILPVSLPGVSTVALLVAIGAWSEYFGALILGGPDTFTAPVGIVSYLTNYESDFGTLAAGTLFIIVPILMATIVAQRGLMKGLVSAAVKG